MRQVCIAIWLIAMGLIAPARAQDTNQAFADFWDRPTLFGGPGSPRENLAAAGVDINAWLTQTYQGVIVGDGSHDWQYGGKFTATANIDAARFGFWPGLGFNLIYEYEYGDDANSFEDGTLLPTNSIMAFPRLGGYDQDLSVNFSQRFGENFTLSVGKFNLLHLVAKTPLVGGGGEETFLNAAMAGPITGVVPPYLVGAIANIHTEPVDYTIMVYDPRSAQDWDVVSHPFADGVSLALSATVPTRVNGLPGYYGLRGIVSTADGLDLSRIPEIAGLPPQSQDTLTRQGYWYLNASVQQYLYEDPARPGNGWGLFAYAAISDGNPNVFQWTAYGGLAGNSPVPGREMDKWGIGYFRYGLSNDLIDGLDALNIEINDEQGVEAFYNFALTPWFNVTADVQWINPYQSDSSDAVIGILRARAVF